MGCKCGWGIRTYSITTKWSERIPITFHTRVTLITLGFLLIRCTSGQFISATTYSCHSARGKESLTFIVSIITGCLICMFASSVNTLCWGCNPKTYSSRTTQLTLIRCCVCGTCICFGLTSCTCTINSTWTQPSLTISVIVGSWKMSACSIYTTCCPCTRCVAVTDNTLTLSNTTICTIRWFLYTSSSSSVDCTCI